MSKQKDSYYFPHDYDASNDPKMVGFLDQYGAKGYGVYWKIVEMLHNDRDQLLPFEQYIYISIALPMKMTPKEVEDMICSCIEPYRLFASNGEFFWSERVKRNVAVRAEISAARSKAGKESARRRKEEKKLAKLLEKQQMLTGVEQMLTHVNK